MKERLVLFFVMCGWLGALVAMFLLTVIAACIRIPYELIRALVCPREGGE